MDITKRLKDHNENILQLNEGINSLLKEQSPPSPPPVNTGFSDEQIGSLEKITQKLVSLASQTSSTDLPTTNNSGEKRKTILLTHDEINLGNGKKIDAKTRAKYIVSNVSLVSDKTIITLDNDSSTIIRKAAEPDEIELHITIPTKNIDGFINQQFTAKIKKKDIGSGTETDLNNVKMKLEN